MSWTPALWTGSAAGPAGVAAFQGYRNPIRAARAVLDESPHVLLAGSGAARFAQAQGLEPIEDPEGWFTRAGAHEDNHPPGQGRSKLAHGTVGCCVLDREGRLAAGTSTGGVFGKLPGRVGDTPIPGAGAWATDRVAVSSTGQGEYFIRAVAAAQLGWRVESGAAVAEAAQAVIDGIGRMGGDGGLIALDANGNRADPFNSQGMKRAWLTPEGEIGVEVFGK